MRSTIQAEVLAANAHSAATFGDKGNRPLSPRRQFAMLTWMDARLDPAHSAGLAEGDAYGIRNASGRASDDAIRSLVISYPLLGTREGFVIHPTEWGMERFINDLRHPRLASRLKTAMWDPRGWCDSGAGPGSTDGHSIQGLTFSDNAQRVVEDVLRLRHPPLVPPPIPIYGYLSEVKTGKRLGISAAMRAGKAGE